MYNTIYTSNVPFNSATSTKKKKNRHQWRDRFYCFRVLYINFLLLNALYIFEKKITEISSFMCLYYDILYNNFTLFTTCTSQFSVTLRSLIENFLHLSRGAWNYFLKILHKIITVTDFCVSQVLDNHKSVLTYFWIDKWQRAGFFVNYTISIYSKDAQNPLLPVNPSAPPNLYPFFSQNCLHVLSESSRVLWNSLLKKRDQ